MSQGGQGHTVVPMPRRLTDDMPRRMTDEQGRAAGFLSDNIEEWLDDQRPDKPPPSASYTAPQPKPPQPPLADAVTEP